MTGNTTNRTSRFYSTLAAGALAAVGALGLGGCSTLPEQRRYLESRVNEFSGDLSFPLNSSYVENILKVESSSNETYHREAYAGLDERAKALLDATRSVEGETIDITPQGFNPYSSKKQLHLVLNHQSGDLETTVLSEELSPEPTEQSYKASVHVDWSEKKLVIEYRASTPTNRSLPDSQVPVELRREVSLKNWSKGLHKLIFAYLKGDFVSANEVYATIDPFAQSHVARLRSVDSSLVLDQLKGKNVTDRSENVTGYDVCLRTAGGDHLRYNAGSGVVEIVHGADVVRYEITGDRLTQSLRHDGKLIESSSWRFGAHDDLLGAVKQTFEAYSTELAEKKAAQSAQPAPQPSAQPEQKPAPAPQPAAQPEQKPVPAPQPAAQPEQKPAPAQPPAPAHRRGRDGY